MDAIEYFKGMRKVLCEEYLKGIPKDSVGYQATLREMSFYDAAIKALEQQPCIQEKQANADKIDAVYIDGFKAGYSQARFDLEQEPCEDWYDVPSDEMTLEQARQAVKDLRKKLAECLKQEPCEDEYIKVPKKALKYRTAGMVAYNAEWLRNHFDIERTVICGSQEPCEDAISRQAVIDMIDNAQIITDGEFRGYCTEDIDINILPSVSTEKTGRWKRRIVDSGYNADWSCSCCGYKVKTDFVNFKYCPNCGAKMGAEE